MVEIRLHGLGGQGIVTAAELLATSAWEGGHWSISFPYFGPERTGAPVEAYVRINERPLRSREAISHPDWLIIREEKLLHKAETFRGTDKNTKIIIDTDKSSVDFANLPLIVNHKINLDNIIAIDAKNIGLNYGHIILANAALIGVFGVNSQLFDKKNFFNACQQIFADKSDKIIQANAQAGIEAWNNN